MMHTTFWKHPLHILQTVITRHGNTTFPKTLSCNGYSTFSWKWSCNNSRSDTGWRYVHFCSQEHMITSFHCSIWRISKYIEYFLQTFCILFDSIVFKFCMSNFFRVTQTEVKLFVQSAGVKGKLIGERNLATMSGKGPGLIVFDLGNKNSTLLIWEHACVRYKIQVLHKLRNIFIL